MQFITDMLCIFKKLSSHFKLLGDMDTLNI